MAQLRSAVLEWYRPRRHAYAWRRGRRSAYRTLVSEVMLQQTQAARVEPIFEAFVGRFPDVGALAAASRADVLRSWAGLGYNRRGVALHEAGRAIVRDHGGRVPRAPGRTPTPTRRRPVHRRRRRIDRLRRVGGRGRHQRPEDLRARDPRSRAGRGLRRAARARCAGLARSFGARPLERGVDGPRPRLLPAGAAVRCMPARAPLSLPGRGPDGQAVRPSPVAVRRERSPGPWRRGGGPPLAPLGERRGARRADGPSTSRDRRGHGVARGRSDPREDPIGPLPTGGSLTSP